MSVETQLNRTDGEIEEKDPWGDIPEDCRHMTPKWLLNGFPKSGLHLVTNLMRPIAAPMPKGQFHGNNWVGTFGGHSWTNNWSRSSLMMYRIARTHPGFYMKGHIGFRPEVEVFLRYSGIAMIFIYRDPRDVAVSQTHHILSDQEAWKHPDKELYKSMGSFGDVLEAVIVGVDKYPGVLDRWKLYAAWLEVPWVLSLRYKDLRESPGECAGRILRYGADRVAEILNFEIDAEGPALEATSKEMAEAAMDTSHSATFRKGKVGGWRDVFTPRHISLFKETDTENWITKLGFEDTPDW